MATTTPNAAPNFLVRFFRVGKAGLLLLAGLLVAGPLVAQTQQAAPAAPLTLAAPDTVAALHRLFAAKRKRQGYATGATALVAVGTLIAINGNQPVRGPGNSDLAAAFGALITLPLIPVVAIGFGGWSARYERQVVEEWRQHRLPRHIKRTLKAKYFR